MTSERKKSIFILCFTLLVGILLGLLVPGFFHKLEARRGHDSPNHGGRAYDSDHKKQWFVGTINRIIEADSVQAKQIRPVTEWAAMQIDSIEQSANRRMSALLDTLRIQLRPIITDAQMNRLEEFDTRAKENWRGRGHPERK